MSLPPQRRSTWMPGLLAILLAAPLLLAAQITTDRQEGLRDNTPRFHALTGGRVMLAPGQVIENGTVIIRDGIIIAAGDTATVPLPEGARVWYLRGRTVYAGFIDLASAVGVPAALRPAPPTPPGGLTGSASAVRAALVGRAITSKNPRE